MPVFADGGRDEERKETGQFSRDIQTDHYQKQPFIDPRKTRVVTLEVRHGAAAGSVS
jgi:hypothetical protein